MSRALTPRGERQAERMSKWLQRRLPEEVLILVSPAKRTQQTVTPLLREFQTLDELAPQASAHQVLELVGWYSGKKSHRPIVVVGHQPTLGLVASTILCGEPQHWSVRTGSVWWLRRRETEGRAETQLVAMQWPELI